MFIVDGLNVYFTTRSSILIPCKEYMKSQHGRRRKERHMGKYPCICVRLRAGSPVLSPSICVTLRAWSPILTPSICVTLRACSPILSPSICVTLRACSPILRFSRYETCRYMPSGHWPQANLMNHLSHYWRSTCSLYFWSLTFPTKSSEILFVSVVFLIKWYHLLTSFTSFWMFILARHLESISYAGTVRNCPAVNLRCWLDAWGW